MYTGILVNLAFSIEFGRPSSTHKLHFRSLKTELLKNFFQGEYFQNLSSALTGGRRKQRFYLLASKACTIISFFLMSDCVLCCCELLLDQISIMVRIMLSPVTLSSHVDGDIFLIF